MSPAAIAPTGSSVAVGAGAAAFLVVPAVLLRRRRWVLRLSATFLILLAAAAVTPPLTGLGRPSEAEVRARVTMGEAPAVATGHRSGVMRLVPFDDDALLLIGAAFAAAAVLLLVLGWLVHRPETGPREVLPMRWRMSLTLWSIALTLVSIPYAISLFSSSTTEYDIILGGCSGFDLYMSADFLLSPLHLVPQPALVAVGFGVWALLVCKGYRRWGRAVGWATVIPLAAFGALAFVMAGLDVVAGEGCARTWGQMYEPGMLAWQLYEVVTAVLIIVAVRVRRVRRPYRSPDVRAAAALAVVLLLVTVPRMDAPIGKVTAASSPVCEPWETARYVPVQPSAGQRELAFLCLVRQDGEQPGQFTDVPDDRVVAIGRRLCEAVLRDGAPDRRAEEGPLGTYLRNYETVEALAYLCPEVEQRQDQQAERQQDAEVAFIEKARARCAKVPGHRPSIRASWTDRATLWSEAGSINAYEDDPDDDFPALDNAFTNGLVGTAPGQLTILTADEAMHVCVTGEAYRRRPPVELKGWERVVEVGYRSGNGDLTLTGDDGGDLENLAVNGPGRYRVRVHMRGAKAALKREGDARQEFLIMVYPGKSERTALLK
ncbi:hypothetical protein AB0H88_25115 [Nonomuraea sp. NPDC050680]|uniref:hypothetical protein n=1 Tax=Nonomuraea sp. NPDC050680 TaxID=3154630 RepID=UPI003411298D